MCCILIRQLLQLPVTIKIKYYEFDDGSRRRRLTSSEHIHVYSAAPWGAMVPTLRTQTPHRRQNNTTQEGRKEEDLKRTVSFPGNGRFRTLTMQMGTYSRTITTEIKGIKDDTAKGFTFTLMYISLVCLLVLLHSLTIPALNKEGMFVPCYTEAYKNAKNATTSAQSALPKPMIDFKYSMAALILILVTIFLALYQARPWDCITRSLWFNIVISTTCLLGVAYVIVFVYIWHRSHKKLLEVSNCQPSGSLPFKRMVVFDFFYHYRKMDPQHSLLFVSAVAKTRSPAYFTVKPAIIDNLDNVCRILFLSCICGFFAHVGLACLYFFCVCMCVCPEYAMMGASFVKTGAGFPVYYSTLPRFASQMT